MKYQAELTGNSWSRGPRAEFATIKEARRWAESWGTMADACTITLRSSGQTVAQHRRDTAGDGMQWFRSS